MNSKKYLVIALVLVVFSGIIYIGLNQGSGSVLASEVKMEPTKYDSGGVDLDTSFTFQAAEQLDPKAIAENISIEPAVPFNVAKGENKNVYEVMLVPQEPLEPNQVYKFTLTTEGEKSLKWAFQSKGDFKVVSTLPRDTATGVPTDTGVEINFSHLNFEKISQYFSISPQVQGKFENHKKTAVFVPQKLAPATVYTVTIKKGLPLAGSSQVLEEDYTFQFETRQETTENKYYLEIYKKNHEFTTQETPFFQLGYFNYQKKGPIEAKITVFSYKDAIEYINALKEREKIPFWAYLGRTNYREDTKGLSEIATFATSIEGSENLSFIQFPEAVPAGYYLAEISLEDTVKQIGFQVTDLGIYGAAANNKTLYWVNDLLSGLPVAGADIKGINGETSKTNDNGLGELPSTSDLTLGSYAVISKGNQEGVAAILPRYDDWQWQDRYSFQSSYWRYLYLDRTLYKPNDTVHFWGVLKPRDANNEMPEKITVALTKGGSEGIALLSKEIKLTDNNFTDSLKLPNLLPGYYYLEVQVDNQTVLNQVFDVENYSKPVYQIEASPDKKAVFAGEKVDFKVKTNFFEGTAAANIPLNYHIYSDNGKITTNSQGEAVISYKPSQEGESYSYIDHRYLYLSANLPESGEITGHSIIMVLNNDLAIDTQGKVVDNAGQIELKLNKLTLDKVNSEQVDSWEKDAFTQGPAANHKVKVNLFEEVWERIETGQYYDFINKKVMPRYEYQYKKVFYNEDQVTTDSEGKAIYTFPADKDKSYLVEFSTLDFRGNTALAQQRIQGSAFYLEYDYPWYQLDQEKDSRKYSVDENVRVSFKKNETLMPEREGGFLFFTCREGIMEQKIQNTGIFNTTFTAKMLPNFWIKGVYFDGRYYYQAPEEIILFEEKDKALKIAINSDKESYRPGDNVKVNLEVRDQKGNPVKATVNLNLVDEALYALQDQYTDLLYSLYGHPNTMLSGIKGTLITHQPPDPRLGGAEGGGEGGSERRYFKDTVLFKTLTTDGTGKASVEFEVPDNLTSWRLTCQAITEDLQGATETSKIIVKLPFFVDMVLSNIYLTGDQITVPIRSYGTELKEGSAVEYELSLKSGDKVIHKESLSGKAFTMEGVPLPPISKGEYDLTLTGKSQEGLTDTLTLTFKVVDSLATQGKTEFFPLKNKLEFTGKEKISSPVTLIFTDYQRSQYLDILWKLNMTSGTRVEQRLAPVMSEKLIKKYFSELTTWEGEKGIELLNYQTPQGGIAFLPYGDADLELSVKLASLNLGIFDNNELVQYFSQIANDPKESRERAIIALTGLAALDEPVLQELLIVGEATNLSDKEKLYLSFAFMKLGDGNNATEVFDTLLKTRAEELGNTIRLNVGDNQDDILEATAMAAALAINLDYQGEAGKLADYALENQSKDILLYLEQLLYLQEALPKLADKPVSFGYKLDNKVEQIKLDPKESFSLILTPKRIENIKFSHIEGQVGVTALYEIPYQSQENTSIDGVKLTRQYEVNGKPTNEFKTNDLVKITLSYQFGAKAPDGPYEVRDFLPAGLKIVERPYQRGVRDTFLGYPITVDGQKAVFLVYDKKDGRLNYYARVINPGQFKAEQALLQHGKSGVIYSVSKEDGVIIK